MIKKYKNYLIINGASENTIKNYIYRINKLLTKIKVEDLIEETLSLFFLELNKTSSTNTVSGYKYAIKSFLTFLKKEIPLPKGSEITRKIPEFITKEYLEKEIMPVVDCVFPNPFKMKTILYFMFYTGLRPSELAGLKRKDIDLKKRTAKIYQKKVNQEIIVLFTEEVSKMLEIYFTTEKEEINAFNITKAGLYQRIRRMKPYIKDINLKPYTFRHAFATHLRENGMKIEDIKELMGHKSIQTTMKYAHANIKNIKKEYDLITRKKRRKNEKKHDAGRI